MKRRKECENLSTTKHNKFIHSNSTTIDHVDHDAFQRDRERIKSELEQKLNEVSIDIKTLDQFFTVKDAIEYLRSLLVKSKLVISQNRKNVNYPPIIWRHHLYALFSNHTKVDTDLNNLSNSNQIRIISITASSRNSDIIIQLEDLCNHFITEGKKNLLFELFLNNVVKKYSKTTYTIDELNRAGFGEPAIRKFMNLGLLTAIDSSISSKQLSFPGLGLYVRVLLDGRKMLLNQIRKSKYSQMLQSELVNRSIARCNIGDECLGIELHLYDIYGSNSVKIERLSYDVMVRIENSS